MVDLHSHILPGFAGAPADIESALQLVVAAQTRGVQAMVATPQFSDDDYREQAQRAAAIGEALTTQLRARGSLIEIRVAAECRIGQRLARAIVMNQVPMLGEHEGRRVPMLRLPERLPKNIAGIVEWMGAQNLQPLIAAPETHREVLRDIEALAPLIAAGARVVIGAGTLAGRHGPYAQRRSRQILERGWALAMGSGARAGDDPGSLLQVGREAAAAIVGEAAAHELVGRRAAAIAMPHLLGASRT
jgi:protein-tyrosine phosphatase